MSAGRAPSHRVKSPGASRAVLLVQSGRFEARFDPAPKLTVPTLTLHGADDPVNAPASSEGKEAFFTGPYRRELIPRCGHFPQREHPEDVARRVVAWLRG